MLDKNQRNFRNSYNYCRLSVSYTSHLYMVQDMNMKHLFIEYQHVVASTSAEEITYFPIYGVLSLTY